MMKPSVKRHIKNKQTIVGFISHEGLHSNDFFSTHLEYFFFFFSFFSKPTYLRVTCLNPTATRALWGSVGLGKDFNNKFLIVEILEGSHQALQNFKRLGRIPLHYYPAPWQSGGLVKDSNDCLWLLTSWRVLDKPYRPLESLLRVLITLTKLLESLCSSISMSAITFDC